MKKNPKVDLYIEQKTSDWSLPIVQALRKVYLDVGLEEEIKWGAPTYVHHGLVCNIAVFKKHVASWFYQGALLTDPHKELIQAQKNTKALRGLRFTASMKVDPERVTQMVKEALLLNEKGIKGDLSKGRELVVPDYFTDRLKEHSKAEAFFKSCSYSKKKEYVQWIVDAKREATRERRLSTAIDMLNEGKGKNDKYR